MNNERGATTLKDKLDFGHSGTENCCDDCPYWQAPSADNTFGKCRRFPQFVLTLGDDWCGEHPKRRRAMKVFGVFHKF